MARSQASHPDGGKVVIFKWFSEMVPAVPCSEVGVWQGGVEDAEGRCQLSRRTLVLA